MPGPVRILIHNDEAEAQVTKLQARHPDTRVSTCTTNAGLPEAIAIHRPQIVYSVRFDTSGQFPARALLAAGGPAWIANGGAGIDHLGHWDRERVTVTNAAGVAADMIAEYVFGCFLHFMLDMPGLQQDKALRRWQMRSVQPLKGKTLLILGLGHTGRAIAARAKAFGMHVTGTRAHPRPTENVDEVRGTHDQQKLIPEADFIVVCTPLTDATRGLVGAAQIAAMKKSAVFVDVSRGGVTDQEALRVALQTGEIAGAALDVFATEPLPRDSALWNTRNLIISPHCSAVHRDWSADAFALFLRNLDNWIDNRPLFNVVDPDLGY